ncbi:hypothetical protein [Microbulbifer sp. 2205BS26-8]|uniref:hypothetical protein n=1 Tax=Microbulbifer sp. 2205BS26-8 TaxID=3064386 RepID=UPI00273F7B9A|nr:hypothetical protein [Microbulbifer sp. 2205BS26-8]MDP5209831.1 hypothetical protein [Microbulbifer sp. 2205BS26-8]
MIFKKVSMCIFIAQIIAAQAAIAGTSVGTKITSIVAQDNRTWIYFSPDIGNATTCTDKSSVEVSNDMTNRDLIMSLAMSAMISGKSVVWLTSDTCSNVDKAVIRGIRVYD